MKNQRIYLITFAIFLIILSVSSALAITASIGNARMILKANVGEKIEKYILVKNVNEYPVDIEIFASGDLTKDIEIIDNNFTLEAGEEKKANFIINVKKSGTTESQINVQFKPHNEEDGKNGAGLSSTIIVSAVGTSIFDFSSNSEENSTSPIKIFAQSIVSKSSDNFVLTLLSITSVVFILLLAILIIASKRRKKMIESKEVLNKPKKKEKKK